MQNVDKAPQPCRPPVSARPVPAGAVRTTLLCLTVLLALAAAAGPACAADAAVTAADSSAVSGSNARAVTGLQPRRLALLGGAAVGLHWAGFRYFDRAWYVGQKQDHIRWIHDWDGETYLNLDKGGHFMGGLAMARSLQDGLRWAGVGPACSAVLGTVLSWGVLMEIEMRDAYYDQWGFSIPDFAANTAGAAIPLLHHFLPQSRVLQFKVSYFPSALYRDRRARAASDRPHVDSLIDDYEGMTFWATLQLQPLLPARAARRWPEHLGIAVGYGATGLHGANVKSKGPNKYYRALPDAQPELFVALDYDARGLPGQAPGWGYLKGWLSAVHLPAPAVRLFPSLGVYLLYL